MSDLYTPTVDDVRTGTLWFTDQEYELLVMTALTDDVFNVAFWPYGDGFAGDHTQVSMLSREALLYSSTLIAEPLPALVSMLETAHAEAMDKAAAEYESRQSTTP